MFTGIVEHQVKILKKIEGETLQVQFALPPKVTLKIGASVLLNGVCSTVTKVKHPLRSKTNTSPFARGGGKEGDSFFVDYMPETRKVTTVDGWKVGELVHFETSLRVGDTLDGHFVFGHVDTVAKVLSVRNSGDFWDIDFTLDAKWLRYFVPKGSVAIDGTSLTVVNVNKNSFSVSLIPHTLKVTHLGSLAKGDRVNIEVDMMAKYAARAVSPNA